MTTKPFSLSRFFCALFLMACGVNVGLMFAAYFEGYTLAFNVRGFLAAIALRMAYEYGREFLKC